MYKIYMRRLDIERSVMHPFPFYQVVSSNLYMYTYVMTVSLCVILVNVLSYVRTNIILNHRYSANIKFTT